MLMDAGFSDSGSRRWALSMPTSRQQDTSFSSAWLPTEHTVATSLYETMEVMNETVRKVKILLWGH